MVASERSLDAGFILAKSPLTHRGSSSTLNADNERPFYMQIIITREKTAKDNMCAFFYKCKTICNKA